MTNDLFARFRAMHQRRGVWEALAAVVAVALYVRTVGFGWVYDDQMEIVLNTTVHSLTNLPTLFTTTVWAGSGMETYLYRPLTMASYAVNAQLAGLAPWSFHLVNVLLHAAVAVLVVRVGRQWGLALPAAGLGGLLFAIHPVHVEAAAAVVGRRDLLATVFALWMVLAHRAALARGGWRLAVPVAAYLATMLSKEVGVVAILLVAAQDWRLEPKPSRLLYRRRPVGLYFAYALALLVYLFARTAVAGGLGVPETSVFDNPLVAASGSVRLATAIMVVGKGLALLAAPFSLSPDYSYDAIPLVRSAADPRFLASVAVLVLVGLRLASRQVRRSVFPVGLAWYALALFPASNLLVTTGTIFGERLLYLPSVAFCLLAGAGIVWVGTHARVAAVAASAVLVGLFTVQTARYAAAWDNDIALFTWAVEHVPRSTKAHHLLGEKLARAGEYGEAARALRRALEIAPGNVNVATTRTQLKQRLATLYLPTGLRVTLPDDPDVLHLLGQVGWERRDLAVAERYWEAALAADSAHANSLADLGVLYLVQGDTARAIARLEQAVTHQPSLAVAWLHLGRIHLARRDRGRAAPALRRFLEHAGPQHTQQVAWARGVVGGG